MQTHNIPVNAHSFWNNSESKLLRDFIKHIFLNFHLLNFIKEHNFSQIMKKIYIYKTK